MANAYYDLKLGAFKPFVGVGIGGARVNDDHEVFAGGLGTKLDVDETRTAFAYQGRAGIAYELSELWDLTAGYRYLHIDGGHRDTAVGRVNLGKQDNHSFELGFAIKPVGDYVEPLAADIDRRPMRQVPAVRQRHPENGVAGFERSEKHGLIRLRSGMGLHVGELGVEKFL